MYNLDFSYKSLEQRQEEKRKEEFKEEKIIQDLKFDEIDSKRALEIFNPLNNLNNPDVPEITYEGYLMGNHRIFIARNFIDKSDIEYCKHMFKFMEHRKQYYREENIIQENYDDNVAKDFEEAFGVKLKKPVQWGSVRNWDKMHKARSGTNRNTNKL